MKNFTILDHTADIAIEVKATSLEELFKVSAEAWLKIVVDLRGKPKNLTNKKIALKSGSYENLLVGFLNELNYLSLTKKWIPINFNKLNFTTTNSEITLTAVTRGFNFDSKSVMLKVEIKAITFHQMAIEKSDNIYKTKIIFDI